MAGRIPLTHDAPPASATPGWRARLASLFRSEHHDSIAKRTAGSAFLIRVASAASLYLSQILFARWMGGAEFGVYVYVWTWTLMIGDLIHLGLANVAPRFIPQYRQERREDLLRGFITASCGLVFASATLAALVAMLAIRLCEPILDAGEVLPLYLACLVLPAYALSIMLDGIARSYNWVGLALLPPYLLRPLFVVVLTAIAHQAGIVVDSVTVIAAAIGASWAAMLIQLVGLRRSLRAMVPAGSREHRVGLWLSTALPVLMVVGFYTLLTYTDILVLRQFVPSADVAVYYAATKTLALVAIIYFAVGAAVAHRFSEYHVSGDRERLESFVTASLGWTFWPSLAAMAVVLMLGWPILALFGADFVRGYPLMFVLAAGLIARASVGPAERLLNMVGEQRVCALVYAIAFAVNLSLCLALVPRLGMTGAALSTASALIAETALLYLFVRRRLGLHAFIVRRRPAARDAGTARNQGTGAPV